MPRDLTLERQDIESMPPISRESGSAAGGGVPYVDQAYFGDGYDLTDKIQRDMSKGTVLHKLRPIQKLLSLDDLESCITLENAAFGHPEHRCTREKVRQGLLYQRISKNDVKLDNQSLKAPPCFANTTDVRSLKQLWGLIPFNVFRITCTTSMSLYLAGFANIA